MIEPSDHLLSRYAPLVDDWDALWATSMQPLPTCIWTNHLKTTPTDLAEGLQQQQVEFEPLPWYKGAFRSRTWEKPGDTLPFVAGWYWVQEEIAMTAVDALDPQPGDTILDLCAAPGNKTVQTASRMEGRGFVIANEWNAGRIASLSGAIARIGLLNVATVNEDGRTFPLPPQSVDRVLADVPCSGEGTLRKNPNRDWSVARTMKAIARLVPTQKRLLDRALDLVKPGGIVVYSTCTFSPEENEAVLDAVMGDRAVVEPFEIPGLRHAPGLTTWQGNTFRSDLCHAHRYFPHFNDTGGFFVARLRRTDPPSAHPDEEEQRSHPNAPTFVEYEGGLAEFGDRFGIPLEQFQSLSGQGNSTPLPLRVWKKGRSKLWVATADCDPLAKPLSSLGVQTLGISLFRNIKGLLKPTTVALQRFGPAITRNRVTLEHPDAIRAFLAGHSYPLSAEQAASLETGYVHVRIPPFEVGCGLVVDGILHSQLPKELRL